MFLCLATWRETREKGTYVRYNDEESDGITSDINSVIGFNFGKCTTARLICNFFNEAGFDDRRLSLFIKEIVPFLLGLVEET